MLSSGNGEPQVCALNVLRTMRGECPYTRGMGLGEHIDRPYTTQNAFIRADVDDQLRKYEKRVDADNIDFSDVIAEGNLYLTPHIRRNYENE